MAQSPATGPDNSGFEGHFILDVPAEHPTLGFAQIAEALAAIVMASEPRFAVGIFGGWGSGKSTLMEAIEERVVNQQQAITVKFNAWRYEREPHLIVPLLDTIRARLTVWAAGRAPNDPQGIRVRELALRIGRVVRALVRATSFRVGVPGTFEMSLAPGDALDELNGPQDDAGTSPQSLYFGAFEELRAAFADVYAAGLSRLIVFVDDLDRCLPDRALTVLESMKLFFDMPGFVFIVGLDERVVNLAVRTKFRQQEVDVETGDSQIEAEYLNKIFQVPYTLPAMAPAQLDDLLKWMADHGGLSDIQRKDLQNRVRQFLNYVAVEGRINPREVKRYINAYTLHRMIRRDLEPNTLLALQTIEFRPDWEAIYDEMVIPEPELFVDALGRYRDGENHAFEDLWPEIGVLPLELANFFRSTQASSLAATQDVERYVSLLESTRSSHTWVTEAMRDVGMLRRHIRETRPPLQFGDDAARDRALHLKELLGRIATHLTGKEATILMRPIDKLKGMVNVLAPAGTSEKTTPEELEAWQRNAMTETKLLQDELRVLRRSSAFGVR